MESVLRYGCPWTFSLSLAPREVQGVGAAEALDQMFAHRHTVGLVDDEEDDDAGPTS